MDAEHIRNLIESRGYEVVCSYDPDLGDVLDARVEGRVVARVTRFLSLEEGLRALAGELGLPTAD